ncbi:MAG: DUF2961 domain-containing protein [Candidatus Hydrogenedentes bacterium]|nr:DUF2961 domain-containing protein [Candidatus Hydrogenedentota bacterium]
MNTERRGSLVVGCLAVLLVGAWTSGETVTFQKLLREMTDLEALTGMPDPAYTCRQFSSYDRRSTDPAQPTDENWFANGDRGQFLRTEERNGEKEYVLMDADGPGAVVRLWSANPNDAGTCRIYLDGAAAPEIEASLEDLLGGKVDFCPAPIAGTRGRGWTAYLPIPYAKHCKITASQPDFYYHINYRTYEAGTRVRTFSMPAAQREARQILRQAERLASPEPAGSNAKRRGWQAAYQFELLPGATELWIAPEGAGEIVTLTCKAATEGDLPAALRGCLLEVIFDNAALPAVQAPLGDFFSTAPGINAFEALPCGVHEDGTMYSHWRMPYRDACTLRITNHTQRPVSLEGRIHLLPRRWDADSLYFHAKWRAERDILTRPRQDWTALQVEGKGRYVGLMLHMANPVKAWWGEGDEKIYVDGESFPSHFGTGSEDYFSYAWCDTQLFSHAYHNQVRCDGPANFGHTTVNRFHILDNIPFTTAFKFDIEVWHWEETKVSQSTVAYWYARPEARDGFAEPAAASLVLPDLPAPPVPKRVEGALEGEGMTVKITGGSFSNQTSQAWPWSNAEQLWWIDAKAGDALEATFTVAQAGRREVLASFTKAPDYGMAQLSLDGAKLGSPMDFFDTGVTVTPEVSLGVHDLPAGPHVLRVEITGSNPNAIPRHMFGLDYLRLKPVE